MSDPYKRIKPKSWADQIRIFAKDLIAYADAVEAEDTFRPENGENQYAIAREMNGPNGLVDWLKDLAKMKGPENDN